MDAENEASAGDHCGSAGKGLLAMKLRRVAAGKTNGLRTPLRLPSDPFLAGGKRAGQVSARKLGARLWELDNPQIALLRHRHELSESLDMPDFSSPSSSERPQTAISSRSHFVDSYVQNINLIRSTGNQQPKFTASYSSSIEPQTAISSRSHSVDSYVQNINLIRKSAGNQQPKFPASYSSSIEPQAAISSRSHSVDSYDQNINLIRKSAGNQQPKFPASYSSSIEPQTAISSRSHSVDSYVQNINLIRKSVGNQQPKFPASYSSSRERVTPSCSFDLKRVLEESEYGHKTSTAVEVLNRVWSLEEQYASSMSLIKALKVDFSHVLSCVQEVMGHHEMLDLRMKIVEDGLSRINEEEDVINAAVQSINEELENEKSLRRRSENFHHMLSKELYELKSACSKVMKDLDVQIKANNLLEEICDEFAISVRAYEQELRNFKHHLSREIAYSLDSSLLQISESWLEKRLQMNIADEQRDLGERNKIMERLNGEIMIFLQARRSRKSANVNAIHQENKCAILHRHSVESLHLNENGRALQDASVDDSLSGDFNSIDLKVDGNGSHELPRQNEEEIPISQEPLESRISSLQGLGKVNNVSLSLSYDQEQADKIALLNAYKVHVKDDELIGTQSFVAGGLDVIEGKQIRTRGFSSLVSSEDQGKCSKKYNEDDHMSDHLSECLSIDVAGSSGSKKVNAADSQQAMRHCFLWKGHFALLGCPSASSKINSLPNRQQSCQLLLHENSLKAKLLEARLEGKNARWNAKLRK